MQSKLRSRASVGQLMIVGFDGTEMSSPMAELLTRIQPAGVILFGRNIVNAQQTHQLLKECQACVEKPIYAAEDRFFYARLALFKERMGLLRVHDVAAEKNHAGGLNAGEQVGEGGRHFCEVGRGWGRDG